MINFNVWLRRIKITREKSSIFHKSVKSRSEQMRTFSWRFIVCCGFNAIHRVKCGEWKMNILCKRLRSGAPRVCECVWRSRSSPSRWIFVWSHQIYWKCFRIKVFGREIERKNCSRRYKEMRKWFKSELIWCVKSGHFAFWKIALRQFR